MSRSYNFCSNYIFKASHPQVNISSQSPIGSWNCEGMNVDKKYQDNDVYYIRHNHLQGHLSTKKNQQKFVSRVQHEEQARGTRLPSVERRLQPVLKANVKKHISSKHYGIIGLQKPLERAHGGEGRSSPSLFVRSNSFQLPAHFHLLLCVLISSAWQFTVDLASSEPSHGGGGESGSNGMKCHSVVAFVTKDGKRR